MTTLLIGAPVLRREWIINRWIDYVLGAVPTNFDIGFVFVGNKDDPTFAVAKDELPFFVPMYVQEIEEPRNVDQRKWNIERYERMANIRNELLGLVRMLAPDYFLSLDTDILIHEDGIKVLLDELNSFDAIGGKTYLSERGRNCPTYAYLSGANGGLRRKESVSTISPDVIMAIKLMKPSAYNIDYVADRHGEDIGWSKAVKNAGLSLGWTGKVASKHVMRPELLEVVDRRVGY